MDGLLKHHHVNERENHSMMLTSSGHAVKLGKRNNSSSELASNDSSFLYHGSGYFPSSGSSEQGLSHTRFHKGFNRKQANAICNDVAMKEKLHDKEKNEKIERLAVERHSRLTSIDSRNGYDPITGKTKTS